MKTRGANLASPLIARRIKRVNARRFQRTLISRPKSWPLRSIRADVHQRFVRLIARSEARYRRHLRAIGRNPVNPGSRWAR